ncbi:calcium/sodium antiporter [Oscillibacter hominis]|uniref:Calcium/sodium antiporter n=1 Tax=Oscillibacter hominis TaxID=2763056 RepID=A0A7G9B4R1_9FIRM|nr:calcium/sodium antiporter [Oscillibacter hominis]QNL44542.1 calcium/sodium antiporter [Oscillibacter hominis]
MEGLVTAALFLLGLLLIVKGGDYFVDAAVWMAEISGIPQFIIGATVVSLATTLPELMVSVMGVLQGEVDLAVGNAVGSVTANIGLIMGLSVVCIPSAVKRGQFSLKAILMAAAAALLLALCRGGELPLLPSMGLLVIFSAFVWANIRDAKQSISQRDPHSRRDISRRRVFIMTCKFILGVVGIIVGSELLINEGSAIAVFLGVPASIIGVTMVAVGTSLPELVTTVSAIVKRESSMSIGNIIGANVIDLTMILPVCSLISGGRLAISPQTVLLDLPACLLLVVTAILPPLFTGRFYRAQGALMLLLYAGYVVLLIL